MKFPKESKYLVISIVLHVLLFSLLLVNKETKKEPVKNSKKDSFNVKVIEQSKTSHEQSKSKAPGNKSNEKKECENHYGGIGILSSFSDDYLGFSAIEEIYEGYPADRNGLKVDDKVKPTSSKTIRGKPGSVLTLKVKRDGETFTKRIVREKVCYQHKNDSDWCMEIFLIDFLKFL